MAALTSIAAIANTVNTRISREAAKIHLAARAMLRPGRWRPTRGIVSPTPAVGGQDSDPCSNIDLVHRGTPSLRGGNG